MDNYQILFSEYDAQNPLIINSNVSVEQTSTSVSQQALHQKCLKSLGAKLRGRVYIREYHNSLFSDCSLIQRS